MKSIIIAALVGAMTVDDVNALRVTSVGPAATIAEQAAAIAEKAGNEDKEKENKKVIKAQAGAEQTESRNAEVAAEALNKQIEARIAAESKITLKKSEAKKLSAEEKEEALQKKITVEIKARKAIADEAIETERANSAKASAENEIRYRKMHDERKAAIAGIEAETARLTEQDKQIARAASKQRKSLNDQELVANLPEHHLRGYVGVADDVEDLEDESSGDDEDLIGVHDDNLYADEDAAADANNEEN